MGMVQAVCRASDWDASACKLERQFKIDNETQEAPEAKLGKIDIPIERLERIRGILIGGIENKGLQLRNNSIRVRHFTRRGWRGNQRGLRGLG
jgi:hypothetical protein